MFRHLSSGFTLIEILVVLLIVSIMSSVVIANMPSFTRSADVTAEVKRLQVVMELAREEALMQSSEFGFRLEKNPSGDFTAYGFMIYDDEIQSWVTYDQRPLHQHELPDGMRMLLAIEGEGFQLDEAELGEDETKGLPAVMLLSSGETTPFELTLLIGRDTASSLSSDGYSRITVADPDAQ